MAYRRHMGQAEEEAPKPKEKGAFDTLLVLALVLGGVMLVGSR